MKALFFLLLCFACPLVAQEERQTINVTTGEWLPYVSEKMLDQGVIASIVARAFAEQGIEVNYHFFNWLDAYRKAAYFDEKQPWHASILWRKSPERNVVFHFSEPVLISNEVVLSLGRQPLAVASIKDLYGLRAGALTQSSQPLLENAADNNLIQLQRAGSYKRLMLRLLEGKIDVLPIDELVGNYYVNQLSPFLRKRIHQASGLLQKRYYHLIASRQQPEAEQLIRRFNLGLAQIKQNGRYQILVEDSGLSLPASF